MEFDGSYANSSSGAGVVPLSPNGNVFPFSFKLDFKNTNNTVEYEALLLGLNEAKCKGIKLFKVKGISREQNTRADSLAVLASLLLPHPDFKNDSYRVEMIYRPRVPDNVNHWQIFDTDAQIKDFLECARSFAQSYFEGSEDSCYNQIGVVENEQHKTTFITPWGTFAYNHMPFGKLLGHIISKEGIKIDPERVNAIQHLGLPSNRTGVRSFFGQGCEKCQFLSGRPQLPTLPLKPVVVDEPFRRWGIDFVGPINPHSSAGHMYILTAMDYFTKCVEAIPTKKANSEVICDFLKHCILVHFGVPQKIVVDNASYLSSEELTMFCYEHQITLSHSSDYFPQGNGLAELSNKNLVAIMKKLVDDNA
ncbi:uncharacterized protein LOC131860285 [Cryptomeria japonica]|uniref:uncharacterized protein LOC131860285 n=1 Tax=Cryptomeria japonica TaxID=3369 RepID=UPI0027DAA8F7|nr:uncharacterized protein LOC131860285 [Cryptomeria japonica]